MHHDYRYVLELSIIIVCKFGIFFLITTFGHWSSVQEILVLLFHSFACMMYSEISYFFKFLMVYCIGLYKILRFPLCFSQFSSSVICFFWFMEKVPSFYPALTFLLFKFYVPITSILP